MQTVYDISTVFWRDWIVFRRHIAKFILARMIAPLLYLTALGWGLGRSVNMGGSYMDFLVPGIIALNSMNISFHSIISLHAERAYHKSLDVYILAPIKPAAFLLGKLLGGVFKSIVSTSIIFILALFFGANVSISWLCVLVIIINSFIFAELGFFSAMKVSTYEEMSRVSTYFLLPMTFLCGTFFRVDALPSGIGTVINLLPLTHAAALIRSLSLENTFDIFSLFALIIYASLGFIFCLKAYKNCAD